MALDIYLNKIVEVAGDPEVIGDDVAAELGYVIERVGGSAVEKHFKCKRKVFDIMDYDAPFTARDLNRSDYEILNEMPNHTVFVPKGERDNFFEDEDYSRHVAIDNDEFIKKVDDAYCWVDWVGYARIQNTGFFDADKVFDGSRESRHLLRGNFMMFMDRLRMCSPEVYRELADKFETFESGALNNFDFATIIP